MRFKKFASVAILVPDDGLGPILLLNLNRCEVTPNDYKDPFGQFSLIDHRNKAPGREGSSNIK